MIALYQQYNIAIKMVIRRSENLCNCTEHLENFKGPRKCVGLSQNASIYLQKENFKNDLDILLIYFRRSTEVNSVMTFLSSSLNKRFARYSLAKNFCRSK